MGNFVDLAGMATLHLSPIWVFAVVSDVAYGSKTYLRELAVELQERGLIKDSATIHRVDDLLAAIQVTTAETASLISTPPLSVEQLKLSIEATRSAIAAADNVQFRPRRKCTHIGTRCAPFPKKEGVSLLGVSGVLTMHMLAKVEIVAQGALVGVEVAGGLLNRSILAHYVDGLHTIHEQGFYHLVRSSATPYTRAVWRNFAAQNETWTTKIVTGRLFAKLWKSRALPWTRASGRSERARVIRRPSAGFATQLPGCCPGPSAFGKSKPTLRERRRCVGFAAQFPCGQGPQENHVVGLGVI